MLLQPQHLSILKSEWTSERQTGINKQMLIFAKNSCSVGRRNLKGSSSLSALPQVRDIRITTHRHWHRQSCCQFKSKQNLYLLFVQFSIFVYSMMTSRGKGVKLKFLWILISIINPDNLLYFCCIFSKKISTIC